MIITPTQQKMIDILNDLADQKMTRKAAVAALVQNGMHRATAEAEAAQTLGEGDDVVDV